MASLKHTSPFFIEPGFKVLPITPGLEFEIEVGYRRALTPHLLAIGFPYFRCETHKKAFYDRLEALIARGG